PEPVRALIREGKLTAGHARTLVGVPDAEARANEIINGMLNVRQAEQRSTAHKSSKATKGQYDPNTFDLESRISNALGLKVKILHKGSTGGEVRIAYKSLEQLDEIARRLNKP